MNVTDENAGTGYVPNRGSALKDQGRGPKPIQLLVIVAACVFAGEWSIMLGLEIVWPLSPAVEMWVDPIALVAILTPLLYLFLFRPMAGQIVERKRAEAELRYSEQKYQTLVEDSTTGIYLVRDWRIVYANPALLTILGAPRDKVIGAEVLSFVHPDDRPRVAEITARLEMDDPGPPSHEFRIVRGDGEFRWVVLRPVGIPYSDGLSVIGTMADVTDRREEEEERRQISAAVRELSVRVINAQEEERGRVARELHDGLGQSLNAVKLIVERVISELRPDEQRKSMLFLKAAIPAVQSAIDEVRTISLGLRPSILDDLGLAATVRWALREFSQAYSHISLATTIDFEEESVPEELKIVVYRILQEALSNAGKHSGATQISVKLEGSMKELVLEVRDSGKGFDEGTQRPEARRGSGILNMRERARLSGGRFLFESAPGKGTGIRVDWRLDDWSTAREGTRDGLVAAEAEPEN